MPPTAYLDNNLVSALAKRDLEPQEMTALEELVVAHDAGRVQLVTSDVTKQELDRWQSQERRTAEMFFHLLQKVRFFENRFFAFWNQEDRRGTVCTNPYPVQDATAAAFESIGLDQTDSHHVMLALRNQCDYFVTCDRKSILKYRAAIEAKFPTIKLVQPTHLVAVL